MCLPFCVLMTPRHLNVQSKALLDQWNQRFPQTVPGTNQRFDQTALIELLSTHQRSPEQISALMDFIERDGCLAYYPRPRNLLRKSNQGNGPFNFIRLELMAQQGRHENVDEHLARLRAERHERERKAAEQQEAQEEQGAQNDPDGKRPRSGGSGNMNPIERAKTDALPLALVICREVDLINNLFKANAEHHREAAPNLFELLSYCWLFGLDADSCGVLLVSRPGAAPKVETVGEIPSFQRLLEGIPLAREKMIELRRLVARFPEKSFLGLPAAENVRLAPTLKRYLEMDPEAVAVEICKWAQTTGKKDTGMTWLAWACERHPPLARPYRQQQKNRSSLPALRLFKNAEWEAMEKAELPGLAPRHPQMMLELPGFRNRDDEWLSWLLWLYDQSGVDRAAAQGRGSPWEQHLWIGAYLRLGIDDRDGEWRTLRFPTAEVVKWLHPNGWGNVRRDWHRFPQALHRMHERLSHIPVPGVGSVAMIFPSVIPENPEEPLVEFTLRCPYKARRGDRIDWNRLCHYRQKSASLYRAYLAATALLGRSAKDGQAIQAQIETPILGADGQPVSATAMVTIDNPEAAYVPAHDDRALARMLNYDSEIKQYRAAARKAFATLAEDGVIDLRKGGDGWRIFAP